MLATRAGKIGGRTESCFHPKRNSVAGPQILPWHGPIPQRVCNFAARQGHTVLYLRAPRLFETLLQSKADGSHLKTLTRLAKVQLLILDDLFLTPLNDAERKDLLEIIEDRHHKAPTVITSQCPTKDCHHIIGEPTIADAVCDRLLHHAYKIELKGESIRKTKK